MGKAKTENNDKEIYRKKPFSGKIKRDLEKEYVDFLEKFRNIPKESSEVLDFLESQFGIRGIEEKNPDLKIIVFFCRNDDLRRMLIDLGNRGANLTIIWDALKPPDIPEYLLNGHPIGLQLHEGELSPYWDEVVRNFETKRRDFFKSQKVINNAVRVIASLKPIRLKHFYKDELPLVNTKLIDAQNALSDFQRMIDIYFNAKAIKDGLIGYPANWGLPINKLVRKKFKPLTQRSHKIWNRRIVILVDELERIGYSRHQSYIKTGELLNLAYPKLWRDKDADLVRQRHTYQIKSKINN